MFTRTDHTMTDAPHHQMPSRPHLDSEDGIDRPRRRRSRAAGSAVQLRHSIEIDADRETVWELTINVEALPALSPTMTRVDVIGEGPLSVGSTVQIKQPGQRAKVWTVTKFDRNRRFSWVTRSMGTTMTASHELRPTATGTTNTLIVDIAGPRAPLVARLIRRPVLAALAEENAGFKTAAESGRTPESRRRPRH